MIKVARYHLVTPWMFLGLPWATMVIAFALVLARGGSFQGGMVVFFGMFFWTGLQRAGGWLSFGLALGATRRSFYAGTALLGVSVSLVSGLALAGLQAIERATGGWGLSVVFFRVPGLLNGLLDGPWYVTWLASFAGLSGLFAYGMWYGIVNRRWGVLGLLAFVAVQVLAGLAVARSGVGGNLGSLNGLGMTGVIAALTVVVLAGGHATIRRVTV
jgi:hypothetical protein